MKRLILLISFLLLSIFQLSGQIVTDRPDQTESSSTVGKGNLQIESGLLIGFDDDGPLPIRQILAPTNLFRYGISETFELRLLSQYETFKRGESLSVQGISDLEIGTKIQLLKRGEKNIEIAFLSHLIVPSGTERLTNGEYGTINKLSISHELREHVGIGYNIGYDNYGVGNGDLTYSLALGISVNEKVGIFIEPYGAVTNFEDFVANFDAGLTYLQNENLQFDFSFGTGITDKMNFISLGLSWLILKK